MFSLGYDESAGLIRCHCSSSFSVEEVQRRAVAAKYAIDRCRADHGDVKALIIIDTEVPQDGPVMKAAQRERAQILGGRFDRMAFVFRSSLAKAQMTRFLESENEKAFVSENAAITWLLADRVIDRPGKITEAAA